MQITGWIGKRSFDIIHEQLNSRKKFDKFDEFILPSELQRTKGKKEDWLDVEWPPQTNKNKFAGCIVI